MRIESLYSALAYFPDIDGFWQPEDFPATEREIRSKSPVTVELLSQLARVQGLQGELPAARETLELARQMMTERAEPRARLRWLLEQGRIHCLAMSPTKANEFFVQAWNLANEAGESFFAIDAALMLSTIRPPKSQNEWLQKALSLAETSDDSRARLWLTQLYLLDGWHSYDFRQFEKALESFNKAISMPSLSDDQSRTYPLLWSKARVLRAMGQVTEALEIQERLWKEMQSSGKVNGHVYLEIAECYQLLRNQDEAKANFELAYAELSADGWYSDNHAEDLSRMKYLYKKR